MKNIIPRAIFIIYNILFVLLEKNFHWRHSIHYSQSIFLFIFLIFIGVVGSVLLFIAFSTGEVWFHLAGAILLSIPIGLLATFPGVDDY